MKKFVIGVASLFAVLGFACTAPTSHVASTDQKVEGDIENPDNADVVGVSNHGDSEAARAFGAAAPVGGGGWTQIASGNLNLINFPTQNNPTGGYLRITITGCQLTNTALSILDSNSFPDPVTPPPSMLLQPNGSYVGYWQLQRAANLGYITLTGLAVPQAFGPNPAHTGCFAQVEQQTGGFNPGPGPQPRPTCVDYHDQFSCQSAGCQANFVTVNVPQLVFNGFGYVTVLTPTTQFSSCTPRPFIAF
jgi:hypothetical protein